MCGIVGIKAFSEKGQKNLVATSKAVYSLQKRGPDSEGLFFNNNVALGHRRLKIIDTSDNASQPMVDASGRYTIVFNGEIFNYRELKKQLLLKGIHFVSESDTEVLLHLFILEKEKCLEKLDGEFAFAIYDKQEASLFLARDRFGIKPLYYFVDEDKFVFASEMKAILAYEVPKHLDEASLQLYLHLNYIPAPDTIFKQIKKLPSGSYVKVQGSQLHIQYYNELNAESVHSPISYNEAKKKLHDLLNISVQNRMVADVPLGCFLSGGLDSSVISFLATRHTQHLQTFSIGYKDEKYFDETQYAMLVSKKIKSDHTVFSLGNDDLFANLHSVLDYMDEPFADSSALAVYILSMHARKHVKVVLSGDGADELFGGYNKHTAELKARRGGIAASFVKSSGSILKSLPRSRNTKMGNKIRQMQKFSEGMNLDEKERYWKWAGFATEKEMAALYQEVTTVYKERKEGFLRYIGENFNSILRSDIKLVLENDMLVKVDRMSMANSLEVRVPFLDNKVVNFAFTLPSAYKNDGSKGKIILKDAFAGLLPEEIFSRKKQGFEVPLLKWFRTELKTMIEDDLLSEKCVNDQGIFNYEEIAKIKYQLMSNNPNDSVARMWALVVFQYWWKKYYV